MGRSYAVASGKGGVGKTVTATNLAATLAAAGRRVAVVDADLGMANLGSALGVEPTGATVHDVLAGEAAVDAATDEGPAGLSVVPGSRDLSSFSRGDPAGLEEVVDTLAADHDYVFVDVGAGLSNDTVAPLGAVDEVLLVSTDGRDALRDAAKTGRMAERVGTPVAGAVLTRTDDAERGRDALDAAVLATVPDDDAVDAALAAGEPLPVHTPASPAAAAYRELARALTGESIPEPDATVGSDATAGDDFTRGDSASDEGSVEGSSTADEDETADADSVVIEGAGADIGNETVGPSEVEDEGTGGEAAEKDEGTGGEAAEKDEGTGDEDDEPAERASVSIDPDDEDGTGADDPTDRDADERTADGADADDEGGEDESGGILSRLFGLF